MLPPFIIEQIRQREEEARRKVEERPRLDLPLEVYPPSPEQPAKEEEEQPKRGIVILDLG